MRLRVALGVLALGLAMNANAVTIDFESGNTPPDPPPGYGSRWTTLRTGEYVFTCVASGSLGAYTINTRGTNFLNTFGEVFASNDSIFIGKDGSNAIFMSRTDFPAPFSLSSFQASKVRNDGFNATTLRVAGALAGGGVLEVDFTLDSIQDGNGGLEDFQTFTLPALFSDVLAVSFTGIGPTNGPGHFLLDNLVAVAVPEPATALLLGLGLAVVAARPARSGLNVRERREV
jgi:hypothetical protein